MAEQEEKMLYVSFLAYGQGMFEVGARTWNGIALCLTGIPMDKFWCMYTM